MQTYVYIEDKWTGIFPCLTWPCNADRYALGFLDCAGIAITGLHNLTLQKRYSDFSQNERSFKQNATKI